MLNIIHVFWDVVPGFYNDGKFAVWIESCCDDISDNMGYYPYQHSEINFAHHCSALFDHHIASFGKKEVRMPCNKKNEPIPSTAIAAQVKLDNLQFSQYRIFILNVAWIKAPLAFLKAINTQRHYFKQTLQLGCDTKFWIIAGKYLTNLIKNDDYIPAFVIKNNQNIPIYYAKWQIISSHYQENLLQLAAIMPLSASLNSAAINQPLSMLIHFSEVTLNTLLKQTIFTQKIHKFVKNSCLLSHVKHTVKPIKLSIGDWQNWKSWKNDLIYDQFGTQFNLVFRLNEPLLLTDNFWTIDVLLQAKSDHQFNLSINDYWLNKASQSALYTHILGDNIERSLLIQLGYACRICPYINQLFQSATLNCAIKLSTDEAYDFLKNMRWALYNAGYLIVIPDWWADKSRIKTHIKIFATRSKKIATPLPSYFCKDELIDFDYQLSIGDELISPDEWQQLIDIKRSLVFFRGQWVEINSDKMQIMHQQVIDAKQHSSQGKLYQLLQLVAQDEYYRFQADSYISEVMINLHNKDKFKFIEQPEVLQATLRPYQLRGLAWLCYLESIGINPCLADDMGLGKTIQVIALMLKKPQAKASLLIAPTSVLGSWIREIKRFAPSLKTTLYHGHLRKAQDFETCVVDSNLIITSYSLLRRDKLLLNQYHWARIIIDEAQNIKNPLTVQTKIIFNLKADFKIALTGTPVENRLLDLWSIFNFLNPGLLGTRAHFKTKFELPIQRDNDEEKINMLKKIVEPFILRRLKSDKQIIRDLPDKIEQKIYCQLTKEQALIYQSIVDDVTNNLEKLIKTSTRSNFILTTLLRLKQVCNHPAQALDDNSEFSIARSFKLCRLIEMVQETINNHESILIFSQYKDICDALNRLIKQQFGYTTYQIDGSTSALKREAMIASFQAPQSPPAIFILSLKAGGVGITLTKANHVFHFDRWWNPAVENQATDRAYRIGQSKTVFAYKFVTLGTIEERIDQMIEDKKQLSASIISHDESWLTQLDNKSFIELIKLSQTAFAEE